VIVADKAPIGLQIPTIIPFAPYIQESFDLNRLDVFAKSLGSEFYHWKASPSPIGLNDKGDYRRNNQVDVMTSNGYIYDFGGRFTATMTSNQKDQKRPAEGALIDASTAYLVLPRFYDDASDVTISAANGLGADCNDCTDVLAVQSGGCEVAGGNNAKRIYLTPGDRLYSDPTIDNLVVNKELMNFSYDSPNVPMFPIVQMDAPIIDSRGIRYFVGTDFNIDCNGNIVWVVGAANPGVDPDTGAGRTYSIRYLYRAFYYVSRLLREVRVTQVTEGNVRRPERMSYYVELVREYVYHNINRGGELNKPGNEAVANRQTPQAIETINLPSGIVRVEQTDIDDLT
jgi:hypothetical protein